MPLVGLEPTRRKTPVPKTGTSTIPSQGPSDLKLRSARVFLILRSGYQAILEIYTKLIGSEFCEFTKPSKFFMGFGCQNKELCMA